MYHTVPLGCHQLRRVAWLYSCDALLLTLLIECLLIALAATLCAAEALGHRVTPHRYLGDADINQRRQPLTATATPPASVPSSPP